MGYDNQNVFAQILKGQLEADKVYEDDHVLAFHDIAKLTPVHVLVIPKGKYVSLDDFVAQASDLELASYMKAIGKVAGLMGVTGSGFRVVSNNGIDANQEVMHFHSHVFGGKRLGGGAQRTS
ncbi:MAG: HIT domain-containing protein [Pseudomonadota bacterium]|nr:HIT domain-containing protein [Pseudomonadota bacterium]